MNKHIHIHLHDGEKTGAWVIAARQNNAMEKFINMAQERAGLTRTQAEKAFLAYRKAKVIKIDVAGGQYSFTHGDFAEKEVLRRAAGLE